MPSSTNTQTRSESVSAKLISRVLVFQPWQSAFLSVVILTAYVSLALYPFHLRPYQYNHAQRQNGKIHFPTPGLLYTKESPRWLQTAISRNTFIIHLRIRASSSQQSGPARIFTISCDPYHRNFTIAQDGSSLVIRLRTPETSLNGLPAYAIPDVFGQKEWQELQVSVRPNAFRVALNGKQVLTDKLPEAPLESWNPRYSVALGNEFTGDRPWRGEIERADVRIQDKTVDLLQQEYIQPAWYFPGFELDLFPSLYRYSMNPRLVGDAVLNFICFIPVGGLLVLAFRGVGGWLLPTFLCACCSATVEFAQVFFAGRFPSAVDLILNTGGAMLGATGAMCVLKQQALRTHKEVETFGVKL